MQREFIATLDWVRKALEAKDKKAYWPRWQAELARPSKLLDTFSFLPDLSAITYMPLLSFILCIPFQLQKPYLSKDERDFYLLDNPLRREKVFQVPMVASTSWKGALRAALWQLGYKEDHEPAIRLLGNARDSDEHCAGRLNFYPTFFDQIALEAINPHSRKTGVGKRRPILMECVPGGIGTLLLLYVPFGLTEQSDTHKHAQVAQDLEVLAQGVQAMLTTYGFGAKTSSGFGTASDLLAGQGTLVVRVALTDSVGTSMASPQPPQPTPGLPRYLESPIQLHADLRRPDGSLKSEAEYQTLIESRGQKYTKKDKQLYDKAKGWWGREERILAEATPQQPAPPPSETPPVSEYTFDTLSEFCNLAQHMAAQLRMGGDG